jgi:hypothetical protein
MNDDADQIRGWKDIAAHLKVSGRTARRWERTRDLPLHRVSGGPKDAVFALRSELDAWMRLSERPPAGSGNSSSGSGDDKTATRAMDGLPPVEAEPTRLLRISKGAGVAILALMAVIAVLSIIAFVVTRSRPAPGSRAPAQSQPGRPGSPADAPGGGQVGRDSIMLRLSRPDGWSARVGIPDGEAGQVGGSAGRPVLVLRPRRMGDRLLLEIARADGRPVSTRQAPGPLVVVLERGVVVDVLDPFTFQIVWELPGR